MYLYLETFIWFPFFILKSETQIKEKRKKKRLII